MIDARIILPLVLLGILAPPLSAQQNMLFPQEKTSYLRSITSLEGGVITGDPRSSDYGPAFGVRVLNLWDPHAVEGAYWSLGTSATMQIDSVKVIDTQPFGVGWRGRLFGWPIGEEAGLNLTLGTRQLDRYVQSTVYLGIGQRYGLIVPLWKTFELGLFWTPVINVVRFGAGDNGPYSNYSTVQLAISWKTFRKIDVLPWSE